MHCHNLRLVLGLGLVRASSRVSVKVRVSVMVRVSIRASWVVNFALFRCYLRLTMHQVSSLFNHCYRTCTLYENIPTRVLYFMARRRRRRRRSNLHSFFSYIVLQSVNVFILYRILHNLLNFTNIDATGCHRKTTYLRYASKKEAEM